MGHDRYERVGWCKECFLVLVFGVFIFDIMYKHAYHHTEDYKDINLDM